MRTVSADSPRVNDSDLYLGALFTGAGTIYALFALLVAIAAHGSIGWGYILFVVPALLGATTVGLLMAAVRDPYGRRSDSAVRRDMPAIS
jgi:hypothetical protein